MAGLLCVYVRVCVLFCSGECMPVCLPGCVCECDYVGVFLCAHVFVSLVRCVCVFTWLLGLVLVRSLVCWFE